MDEAERLVSERLADDGTLPRESYEELLRAAPHLAAEIGQLYESCAKVSKLFGALRDEVYGGPLPRDGAREVARPTSSATRPPARVRNLVLLAAAAVVLVVLGWHWWRPSSPRRSADLALVETASRLVGDMAQADAKDVREDQVTAMRTCSAIAHDVVAELEMRAVHDSRARAAHDAALPILRTLDQRLADAQPKSLGAALVATASSLVQARTPEVDLLLLSLLPADAGDALTRRTRELFSALRTDATLDVRVFDLDDQGREFRGAQVFARRVDLPTGEVDPDSILLGTAPIVGARLAVGDWQLSAYDRERERRCEERLLVLPGRPLAKQTLFLRTLHPTEDARAAGTEDEMVWMEPCTFRYGVEPGTKLRMHSPAKPVRTPGFWVDPYEVTNRRYASFYVEVLRHPEWLGEARTVAVPMRFNADGSFDAQFANHPVVGVAWDDAVLFANWAGKRLPADREWERVAKGPQNHRFPWGDDFAESAIDVSHSILKGPIGARIDVPANFVGCGPVDDPRFAGGAVVTPSGAKVWRLADNVSEWVEDLLAYRTEDERLVFGLADTLQRVVRGGSWQLGSQEQSQSVLRFGRVPAYGGSRIGFRCVASLPNPAVK
jgi:formylglycine-generating enzyme required for sulfatase activity